MTFYDRYATLCELNKLKPAAQETVEMIGVTRATITQWKQAGYLPQSRNLKAIADFFHTSIDYLLGRTDDPTDYSNIALSTKKAPDDDASIDDATQRLLIGRYMRLSQKDRERVDNLLISLSAESGGAK